MALTANSTDRRMAWVLRKGRAHAEGRMTSSCRIERRGQQHWNAASGDYVAEAPIQVYEGRCRIKPMGPGIPEGDDAGRPVVVEGYDLLLPADTEGIAQGDVVTMTDTGKVYRVNSVDDSEQRTALHVNVVSHDVWPE